MGGVLCHAGCQVTGTRCPGHTGRCPLRLQKHTSAVSLLWKKRVEKLPVLLARLGNLPVDLEPPLWEGREDTWTAALFPQSHE